MLCFILIKLSYDHIVQNAIEGMGLIIKALDYVSISDKNVGDSRPLLSAEADNRDPSASGNLLERSRARSQPRWS